MGPKTSDGLESICVPAPWATPLYYALQGGDLETNKFLIKKGAEIKGNEEALLIAADGHAARMALLLKNGAESKKVPKPDANKELVYLCRGDRGGNPLEVRRLLKLGADVNWQDHHGKTALHRAGKAGFLETMQILLDHGASTDLEDLKGETALFDALRSTIKNTDNKRRAIELLRNAGANDQHSNHRGKTPRMLQVQ